jgi:hypothetical protein
MIYYGFSAIAGSMEWLPPDDGDVVSDNERIALIEAVKRHCRWRRYKVVFTDDKGKRMRWFVR